MIKSRQEIKLQARESLKLNGNRGTAIAMILIYMVTASIPMYFITPLIGGIGELIADQVVSLFMMVVLIGMYGAFMKIYKEEKPSIGEMFSGFEFFGRNILTILYMFLLLFLWAIPFLIPAIIFLVLTGNMDLYIVIVILSIIPIIIHRTLAYYATLFILSESKEIGVTATINLSKRITEGHKMDIFVMHLSFIGWYILGIFTCGILWLVFVMPYHYTAMSGLYMEMRDEAIASYRITAEELN